MSDDIGGIALFTMLIFFASCQSCEYQKEINESLKKIEQHLQKTTKPEGSGG